MGFARACRPRFNAAPWRDSETLVLRATVIAGRRYADDFEVVWRGMAIGRIMRASGGPTERPSEPR
jgi:hypothetical protein